MIKVAQVSAGTCIPVGAERERQEQAENAQIPDRGQGMEDSGRDQILNFGALTLP